MDETPVNRRVDFHIAIQALALVAGQMDPKSRETGEGGLAVSPVLG